MLESSSFGMSETNALGDEQELLGNRKSRHARFCGQSFPLDLSLSPDEFICCTQWGQVAKNFSA